MQITTSNPRHPPEALAVLVEQDRKLGLVTVACPKCGITAGVLPNSGTWHPPCGGVRMRPADPAIAKRMRQEKIRAQTLSRVRRHRAALHQKPVSETRVPTAS